MEGRMVPMVGTCGFQIRREAYYRQLDTVELQTTFLKVPKIETAERMREQAPGGFDFTVKAWQGITHPATSPSYARAGLKITPRKLPRYGRFQMSKELLEGWEELTAFADALDASVILFQTPLGGADRVRGRPGRVRHSLPDAAFVRARRGEPVEPQGVP